jgi:hypothetical protein
MNDGVVEKTIEVRKLYRIKLPDAINAATAFINDFTFISNNDKDFKGIKELKFKNPRRLWGNDVYRPKGFINSIHE